MEEKKDHIPGIYNYCDRWCEKCNFTSKCFLFTQESKISTHEILNDGDISNIDEVLDKAYNDYFDEMDDFFEEDIFEEDDDDEFEYNEVEEDSFKRVISPLDDLSYQYFNKAHSLVSLLDQKHGLSGLSSGKLDDPYLKKLHDNFEVFSWFHTFIHVKLSRALHGKSEMQMEGDEEMKDYYKQDIDGTAKVAINGINRSIVALDNLLELLPDYSDEISDLLIMLGKIINIAEEEFPDYRNFIRPGLDE